jgi:hypothetical protein
MRRHDLQSLTPSPRGGALEGFGPRWLGVADRQVEGGEEDLLCLLFPAETECPWRCIH